MRDAQGQSCWQWCRAEDFTVLSGEAGWEDDCHAIALSSDLARPPESVPPADTRAAAARPAIAIDGYESWARVVRQGTTDHVMAGGATDPEVEIFAAAAGLRIVEIAATTRDWLVLLLGDGTVVVRDLLDRFAETTLSLAGFAPDRVVETAQGTIWLLDRAAKRLCRLAGNPLPARVLARTRAAHVFQPKPLDPDPLRIEPARGGDLSAIAEELIDAAALPDGRLALLCLGPRRRSSLRLTDGITLGDGLELDGLESAFSLATRGADTLAFAVPGSPRAVEARLGQGGEVRLLGTLLPLRRGTGGRFCATLPGAPLCYPSEPATPPRHDPPRPFARLVAPSRPAYARTARIGCAMVQSEAAGTVWHRLFLEAQLPPDCGLTLQLGAGDDPAELAARPRSALHRHYVGACPEATASPGPRAVWLDQASERPWLPSAIGQARKRDRSGLYSVLVQKTGADVKRIAGRYLRIEIALHGSGLATPRLHALRVWGPRRAWRDRFLPDYMTDETGPLAAGSDFLDRFLGLFESVLTPIEDEVGASWRLTRPDAVPAEALDWLAGWIGAELDPALSDTARRRLLAQSVPLWRRRGTLPGLERVLDIVTDGGVGRGELVVLEHFHLRRTFATILGADLSDAENPLTPWAAQSGNSHLGATFFLGDGDRKAFLALFRPELLNDPLTTEEERAEALDQLAEFFDDNAHRVTVLVHGQMDATRRALIARVLEREIPAHVVARIEQGPGSLVLALSSLLAVDSRIGPPPPRPAFTLDEAEIGQAWLTDAPTLDPRFEGGA